MKKRRNFGYDGAAVILILHVRIRNSIPRVVIPRHEVPKNLPLAFKILRRSLRMTDGRDLTFLSRKSCTRVLPQKVVSAA